MARRPGDGGRFRLSPRARQLAGWVIALLLVLGIAGAVRLLGESGDEGAVVPSPSGAGGAATLAIVFGTELSAERVDPGRCPHDELRAGRHVRLRRRRW